MGAAPASRFAVPGRAADSAKPDHQGDRDDQHPHPQPSRHPPCLVVADRDAATARYEADFGLTFYTLEAENRGKVRGVDASFGLKVGYARWGNTILELLEPLSDRGPQAAWLAEYGEGLHHVGYFVPSISAIAEPLLATGRYSWLFVTLEAEKQAPSGYLEGAAGGLIVELIERTPEVEWFFNEVNKHIMPGA